MGSEKKSMGAAGVLYAIVCLLSIVTFVLYVMNAPRAYYVDLNPVIVALLVLAIVCEVLVVALGCGSQGGVKAVLSDILRIAVPAFVAVAGVMFISARVESLAQVLGSNLELGNVEAHEAATQAVAVIVVSLVIWLLSVVSAFVGKGKRSK